MDGTRIINLCNGSIATFLDETRFVSILGTNVELISGRQQTTWKTNLVPSRNLPPHFRQKLVSSKGKLEGKRKIKREKE